MLDKIGYDYSDIPNLENVTDIKKINKQDYKCILKNTLK